MQHRYAMTRRDVGNPVFSLRKKRFVKTHAISLFASLTHILRIPVKAATQTAGMRPPKPFKEATLSERSDAGSLFLLYLISCRQICLLFS